MILKCIPDLQYHIQHLDESESDILNEFISFVSSLVLVFTAHILTKRQLDKHARNARTDDVGSLRYAAMAYIPVVTDIPAMSTTNRNKSDRGFSHLASARLLCPRHLRDEFDQDREE